MKRSKIKYKQIDKILEEFEVDGIFHTKLKFSVSHDSEFTYTHYLKDGSFHEISIINEDMSFFSEMTISELLEETPFYVNHRFFMKLDPIAKEEYLCDDLFTFRIVDQPEWIAEENAVNN